MTKKQNKKVSEILETYDKAAEEAKAQILAFMEGYNFRKEVEERKPQ